VKIRLLFSALWCFAPWLQAEIVLAPLFQDHLVLQRDQPVPVWGTARAGESVEVEFAGQVFRAHADREGRWRVELAALPANANPRDLIVRGQGQAIVRDVLVGDVWLLSGQSNMEWPVRLSDHAEAEAAAANDARIRHFKVENTVSHRPQNHARGAWAVASPTTVGDFSAVGFFFAREVIRELNVPIGLINSSWGGTPVESWLPPQALAEYPVRRLAAEHFARTTQSRAQAFGEQEQALARWASRGATPPAPTERWTPGPEAFPGVLYQGMIAPLVPFAVRGVLWYQGEGNADLPQSYTTLFTSLIESWRARWNRPDLPFLWVQLANWNRANAQRRDWAQLRDAQTATLALPHTGQAVAIDIGDPDDIHPRNKQEVGRRLARIALAQVHGRPVPYRGPSFAGLVVERDALRVAFHDAAGLAATGGRLEGLEVAGADRIFHPATGTIDGLTVLVRSDAVPAPVAVRYAWSNCPVANLYNGVGLPAVPFRSDDWPVGN
jgi:sialate O-acetylesterase